MTDNLTSHIHACASERTYSFFERIKNKRLQDYLQNKFTYSELQQVEP